MNTYDAQELRAEGRRWVLHPGEQDEGGVRAEVVFEDCPCRFLVGQVSNDPAAPPPRYLGVDADSAREAAIAYAERVQGISRDEWLLIISSSMRAENKFRRVLAKRDPRTSEVIIFDGDGDILMVLEEKEAIRLYQQIAQGFGFEYSRTCPDCTCELENDGSCPSGCDIEDD